MCDPPPPSPPVAVLQFLLSTAKSGPATVPGSGSFASPGSFCEWKAETYLHVMVTLHAPLQAGKQAKSNAADDGLAPRSLYQRRGGLAFEELDRFLERTPLATPSTSSSILPEVEASSAPLEPLTKRVSDQDGYVRAEVLLRAVRPSTIFTGDSRAYGDCPMISP